MARSPAFPQGPVTTTLNDGVTGGPYTGTIANGINFGSAVAVNYYYATSPTATMKRLNPSPVPVLTTTTTPWIITSVPPLTYGNAPTANTAGVPAPTATAGSQAGGTVPTGTYYVATTFTTSLGETSLSNVVTVNVTGPQEIVITAVPNSVAIVAQVELDVSRLEEWHITRYAILTSTSNSVPSCYLYVDSVSPLNILDSTPLGAQNAANCDLTLRPGQRMIAIWTFLDVGASATLSVYGSKTTLP